MSFFEKHKIISSKQFGFLRNHSTEHAILDLKEFITHSLSMKKIAGVLFLDLKKAFDTVSHDILLRKLTHYGIRGLPHELISSYLYQRKQFTIIEGIRSDLEVVRWGVPQGSVLGPLLFLLFINDLPNSCDLSSWLFADDTALAASSENFQDLQLRMNREIDKVQNWLFANKLSVHYAKKTQYILFVPPSKAKDKPNDFTIDMGGNIIEQTESYKYLGVMIDEKLSWKPQIENMCSKLASVCGILSKVRYVLDRNSLMLLYNSLIESRLRYGILSWSTASNKLIDRLKVLQNRALRYIDFSPIGTTILPIYAQFKVLPLEQLIDLQRANYMFSFCNNLLPSTFSSYCSKPTHRYETRYSKTNYAVPKHYSRITETSIKVIGPKIWADVPNKIKHLPFRKTFSKHMKNLYLDKLPKTKRTKELHLEKKVVKSHSSTLELENIFQDSDNDETFYGFTLELKDIFCNSDNDETFYGFDALK